MAKKVLTVDDSTSIRQMVAFTLKSAGYEVVEAADGNAGVTQAKTQQVDLILTDQNMARHGWPYSHSYRSRIATIHYHPNPDADHRIQRHDEATRSCGRGYRLVGQTL